MEETLQKYIDKSNPKTSSSSSTIVPPILGLNMNAETKLFEANGERTQNLEFLYQALMTGKPTSVESERCFSNAGVFATKVRPRLGDRSLCDLVFLRVYFQGKNISRGSHAIKLINFMRL